MAGRKKTEKKPETEIEETKTAEPSKNSEIAEYNPTGIEALKARFGVAEEDESIRNEGFELASSGGLFIKPRPENLYQYAAGEVNPREDIPTDSESELSQVFDSAKSEHDNDNVYFSDLEIDKPKEENAEEKAEEIPEKPAGKEKKTAKKIPEETQEPREEEEKKPGRKRKTAKKITVEEPESDEEEIQIVRKYNTHTRVIFVDEELDDGIKRNSDEEIADFFTDEAKGRKFKLWSPKKK